VPVVRRREEIYYFWATSHQIRRIIRDLGSEKGIIEMIWKQKRDILRDKPLKLIYLFFAILAIMKKEKCLCP
jgi:hypothetical protein